MGDSAASIIPLVQAIHNFEQALHNSIAAGGRVSSAAADAQRANVRELGYLAGHQVIAPLIEAQAHIARAMTSAAEGHRKLSQLGAAMGYRLDDDGSNFGESRKDPQSVISILTTLLGKDGEGVMAAH